MKEPKELLEKYKSGLCSPEELALLHRWIHHIHLDQPSSLSEEELNRAKVDFEKQFATQTTVVRSLVNWKTIAAVASVILLFGVGFYFISGPVAPDSESSAVVFENDVLPGGDVAILTMEDGKKVNLDSISEGSVISQTGSKITKNEEGALVYTADPQSALSIAYHTVETPSKGQYRIVLPDGTKVWVNSESSLKFPTRFAGAAREVELDGEAYFEVAKDSSRPFFVQSKSQKVEVLGTHFNIKSYRDEPYEKTTLLEGAVKVSYANLSISRILKPGDQATVSDGRCAVRAVDVEQAIDWKNGDFIFREESLVQIMKRVSRWYGVDVAYERGVDLSQTFSGQVSRSKNLSEVIACLESTDDLRFVTKNNKIWITKTNPKTNEI